MNSSETRAAQLFLAHHGFVKGVALKIAPWPGLADDIVQQVFLEFIAKESRWDLEKDLRPLLATMTRHVAMRLWRERTRELPETVQQLAEHVRHLAEERDKPPRYEEELTVLRTCLEKLPEKSRELIRRYYFDEKTTAEIGAELEISGDTICRALSRVREKLRACLSSTLGSKTYAHA